jgi:hypothetical protein
MTDQYRVLRISVSKRKFSLYIFLIVVFFAAFIRLLNANENISFDYSGYIDLINTISSLNFAEFWALSADRFPFFPWGRFGSVEVGFAITVFALSKIMTPIVVYAFLASVTLTKKVSILGRSNIRVFRLILFIIFSVSLFELNAIRAGIASLFLMLAMQCILERREVKKQLFYLTLACLFHVSALFFVIPYLISLVLNKSNSPLIGSLLMSCVAFYLMLNLDSVLVLFDDKIAEYYHQAATLGFFSSASGFNITTILCLCFAIRFYLEYRRQRSHNRMSSAKDLISTFPVSFGLVCGCLLFTMIFSAGIFAVFSDRLWQMTLPLLLMIDGFTTREESNFILRELTSTKIRLVSFILSRILDVALLYYIVVNLLLRYPLTNAFSWFFGEIQLEAMPMN